MQQLAPAVAFLRATAYMLSVHMLSQFRLSVRPSVMRVDQSRYSYDHAIFTIQ